MSQLKRVICIGCWLLLQAVLVSPVSGDEKAVWLLIDDKSSTLHVYRGEQEIERYHPVSLGREGVSRLRVSGDNKTPTGEFRINWINRESRFHIFLGLDYPTVAHAREAQQAGIMSDTEFDRYLSDYRRHGAPPQDTILGGNIGIHGLGEGDPRIHERFNWTQGCVAVTNEQIEQLARWVGLGTRVIIR
ncbi:L,D-transpeptidase family protein [Halomonas sp. WWR20]